MKMFRWLAAGVLVILLAVLVFWKTSHVRTAQSLPRSATPDLSGQSIAPSAVSSSARTAAANAAATGQGIVSVPSLGSPFENWVRQYVSGDAAQRAALLAKGDELAKARRQEMAELIRTDPEEAIDRALPYGVRKQLPESILSQIEQPLEGRGDFRPVYYKPLPGRESEVPPTSYEVVMNKTKYETFVYGLRRYQPAHENSYLHGVSVKEDSASKPLLALNESPARILDPIYVADKNIPRDPICRNTSQPIAAAAQPTIVQFGSDYYSFCQLSHAKQFDDLLKTAHGTLWASGGTGSGTGQALVKNHAVDQLPPGNAGYQQALHKLLYIRVTFADDPISPQSDNGAQSTVKANNQYFNEGSYNTVWWESTVTPVIRLPQRKNFYGESPGDLLGDAAAGAAALGYFSSDYFFTYVLCNSLAQYKFGGISSGILNGSPGALSHELGHNFGLPHANFWQPEGTRPGPVQPPNPQPPFPIDPDSLIGHNDINAPFILGLVSMAVPSQEYGNQHDVMGSGPGHFSAMFKNFMDWLPDQFVKVATQSTTNRIYAFDTPRIKDGRFYAMRIRKDFQHEFWLSYRQGFPANPWFSTGLEVDYNFGVANDPQVFLSLGNNVLLDTTPDSTFAKEDAALVVGRTLHDSQANLHITPIAIGGGPDPSDKWIETVVQMGPFPGNQVPTLALDASAFVVSVGATVNFTAAAQDADGDQLAYYWEFGDYTFGANGPVQSKTFDVAGQYVVRCEVSDMKGGVASRHVVVTVGTPTTFTISGRVLDPEGNPVQGVRVHNSGDKPASPTPQPDGITTNSAITDIGTYRYGYTDT
ncbi:MAG TPA: PKD domain-containing protein, partial [Verrucomicrobiae bacterium]